LQREEVDLAITLIEKKSGAGIQTLPLVELPLVLLVPTTSSLASADQLWKRDKIDEPLICLPPKEAICKNFQDALQRKGIDWFTSIEVSSLDLVETYVAAGLGIGLSVMVPRVLAAPNLRIIPLPGFSPVIVGALWRGKRSGLVQAFLQELESRAKWFVTELASREKARAVIDSVK
jgi:DNA-binding transcriptional LysR family regulator